MGKGNNMQLDVGDPLVGVLLNLFVGSQGMIW